MEDMKKEDVDKLSMGITGTIGGILFIMSTYAFDNIPEKCESNIIYQCNTLIMILSLVAVCLSVTYGLCINRFACYKGESAENLEYYFYIFAFIFLILTILTLIMGISQSTQKACDGTRKDLSDQDKKKASQLKITTWMSFGLSLILLFASGYMIYWNEKRFL